jgi:hypothetical protein
MAQKDDAVYNIEGVMTNTAHGWLLALDMPYAGDEGDTLELVGIEPPITMRVRSIVEPDHGTVRDIAIGPVKDMYDARLLVGRKVRKIDA